MDSTGPKTSAESTTSSVATAYAQQCISQSEHSTSELPIEFIYLPKATSMPERKFVWNTQQEVASFLLAAVEHEDWISKEVRVRPTNGTMILYRRSTSSQARNNDGYTWKKKYKRRAVRESHLVLKLNGAECIFANYAHSAILPTFHRRAYFLRMNPNIVLFHYLNVPPLTRDDKLCIPMPTLSPEDLNMLNRDKVMEQLRPMFNNFPTRLTKPDGKHVLYFDVSSVMQGVCEAVISQKEDRAPPIISTDSCYVFTLSSSCLGSGRQGISSCSSNSSSVASQLNQLPAASPSTNSTGQSLPPPPPPLQSSACDNLLPPALSPEVPVLHETMPHDGDHRLFSKPSSHTPIPPSQWTQSSAEMCVNAPPSFSTSSQESSLIFNYATSNHSIGAGQSAASSLSQESQHSVDKLRSFLIENLPPCDPEQKNQDIFFGSDAPAGADTTDVSEFHVYPRGCKLESHLMDSTDSLLAGSSTNFDRSLDHDTDSADYNFISEPDQFFNNVDLMDCLENCLGDLSQLEHQSLPPESSMDGNYALPSVASHGASKWQCSSSLSNSTGRKSQQPTVTSAALNLPRSSSQLGLEHESLEALVEIRHCAPSWAPIQGGEHMLLAGPWYSSKSPYSCIFGDVEVPALLVQNGVLSCTIPSHEAGAVQLQVACEGRIISRPCLFEFRCIGGGHHSSNIKMEVTPRQVSEPPLMINLEPPTLGQSSASSELEAKLTLDKLVFVEDSILKIVLVNKISQLERLIMQHRNLSIDSAAETSEIYEPVPLEMLRVRRWCCNDSLEVVLCRCCTVWCRNALLPLSVTTAQQFKSFANSRSDPLVTEENVVKLPESCALWTDVGLMSLCGALGYVELLRLLMVWFYLRKHQLHYLSSPDCQPEIDLESPCVDRFGLTPLLWTSIRGHKATSRLITRWCPTLLHMVESSSCKTPTEMAESYGHSDISNMLRQLEDQLLDGYGSYRPLSGVQYAALWDALSYDLNVSKCNMPGNSGTDEPDCGDLFAAQNMAEELDAEDFDEVLCGQVQSLYHRAGVNVGCKSSSNSAVNDESQMACLAGRIIQAMPRRIKFSPGPSFTSSSYSGMQDQEGGPPTRNAPSLSSTSQSSFSSVADNTGQYHHCQCGVPGAPPTDDSGISTPFDEYRHANIDTPSSSVSPSGACPCVGESHSSPYNFSMDSPPPTTEEIAEHFNAPSTYMEADFSRLTLSDIEQKKLYEAAKVIQKCYRAYKQNKLHRMVKVPQSGVGNSGVTCVSGSSSTNMAGNVENEGEKEIEAAIIIQSYYRRYKQYAYYKRMCHAAVLIQNQYRWYMEQKKSGSSPGASTGERLKRNKQSPVMVNQKFRNHYQRKQDNGSNSSLSCPEPPIAQVSSAVDNQSYPSAAPTTFASSNSNIISSTSNSSQVLVSPPTVSNSGPVHH